MNGNRSGDFADLRCVAHALMQAARQAADPGQALERAVQRLDSTGSAADAAASAGQVQIGSQRYALSAYERILALSFGKAAAAMAAGLARRLAPYPCRGLVVSNATAESGPFEFLQAGHPVPDENSARAGRKALELLRNAGERDLIFCLISGGGSALLTQAAPPLSLADLQATTGLLLRSGATINELNAVRKHLDLVKGGGLAQACSRATLVSLILSDVVGDPLDVIASGPTVPDPSTYADAWAVLERYALVERVPPAVAAHLQSGQRGQQAETLKPGDSRLARVQNIVIGSNRLAVEAAAQAALEQGFNPLILSTFIEGEAREVARVAAALAKEVVRYDRPVKKPTCLIWGGETSVTVRGTGQGGRNQELALAAALALADWPVGLLAIGTDGLDGPTEAAGAWVDGDTLARANKLGLNAAAYLDNNNAYHFFAALGDLIITGATGTNVNDLLLTLIPVAYPKSI